jgi:nucleoside-diphosphate-sugar epimerase
VAGLARTQEKAAALKSSGYEARQGDLTDLPSLKDAVRDAGAVVHTAAARSADAGAIDRAAVETMLAALAGSSRPFVYTSGIWVYGDTQGRMLGEVAQLHPAPLVAWRPAVEDLVLEAKARGVASVVLRAGMVFGRRGGFVAGMFHDARTTGAVRIVGDGENHWSNIHVDDLADLYARVIAEPAAGELFVACGGMPQPLKKIALAVAKACRVDGKVQCIPIDQARAEMGPMADCLAMDQRVGSTKAVRYFGWTVRKPSIFDEIFGGTYLASHAGR